jgi:hypothetical protein
VIRLRLGESLTFGRARTADVVLDSTRDEARNMISRSHARITWHASTRQIMLIDLNSTNGCYINDRKIDVAHVRHGDKLTFGGRGRSVPIGQIDAQPKSEFIYELSIDGGADAEDAAGAPATAAAAGEDDPSTFELLKTLTDNIQLLLTWVTAALLVGSYLFAEEGSEEHSYVVEYVAPVFAFVGVPFNRITFTISFVASVGAMLAVAIWMLKRKSTRPASAAAAAAGGKGRKKAE